MYKELRNKISRALPLVLLFALFSMPVSALNLDQAKAQGLVKETSSGFLEVVKTTPEAKAFAKKINKGRKTEYDKIGKKRGISSKDVGRLAGQKLVK